LLLQDERTAQSVMRGARALTAIRAIGLGLDAQPRSLFGLREAFRHTN
jgi:hypothetical protein